MSGTTMDDYLLHGPQTALDVIEEITGAETIDIVGLCLGGAMTAITAAYLTQQGDSRIGTLTLLNTMLDYAEPGELSMFTDKRTVEQAGEEDAQGRCPGGRDDGRHLRHPAGQRSDLQLRGVQLADGPGPAGVRHSGLERRQHPDAGRHACVLPAELLRGEQHSGRQARTRRHRHRSQRDQEPDLRRQRDQRPHCARGNLPTRPSVSSPGRSDSCSAAAVISPASSARPGRRPGTW